MPADTSPESTNLTKPRKEFQALYQAVDRQAVWDRIMEFYAATFDKVSDVIGRSKPNAAYWHYVVDVKDVDPARVGACAEYVSADLVGIETYLVTDHVIGDATSLGADHVSDALTFERWVWANY